MVNKFFAPVALCCALMAAASVPASATAIKSGSTFLTISAPARGTSVAYGNGVYLVVSAFGPGNLAGRFVQDGVPIGSLFPIQTTGNYTHFPRAAWSPDADGGAGAFMVSWSETDLAGAQTSMHVRLVNVAHAGAFGTDTQIAIPTNYEAGCAIAYSTVSKEFLVVWQTLPYDLAAVRVNNSAQLIGSVSIPATTDGERDPSVAYNPVTDQFMVVFTGWGNEGAFAAAKRIQAGTGAVLDAKIPLFVSAGTFITGISYNSATNKFLAAWYSSGAYGRVINADGTLSGSVIPLSTAYSAYDALGLDYNPVSDSYLMVSHSNSYEDGAVEIGSSGTPVDSGFIVTDAGGRPGGGNFYPRVAASTTQADWLMSTAHNFETTMAQRVTAGAAGPVTPTLMSPGSGGHATGSSHTFSWTLGTGVTSYALQVGNSPGGMDLYNVNVGNITAVVVGGLPTDGRTLYARLWWYKDSTWSSADYSFTAYVFPAPATPQVTLSGTLSTTTPRFTWTGDAAATWYRVWLQSTSGSVLTSAWFVSSDVCSGTSCGYTHGSPLPMGSYYFWVMAYGPGGYSSWSPRADISLSLAAAQTTLMAPLGTGTQTPTFVWAKSDNATWYRLMVVNANTPASPEPLAAGGWLEATSVGCTSVCSITPGLTLAPGTYYWWVLPWSASGSPGWSARGMFVR